MNSPSERQMGLRPDSDIVQAAAQNVRRLEQKATSCIRIAERILPGVGGNAVEDMAVCFMRMSDSELTTILDQIQQHNQNDTDKIESPSISVQSEPGRGPTRYELLRAKEGG